MIEKNQERLDLSEPVEMREVFHSVVEGGGGVEERCVHSWLHSSFRKEPFRV